MSLETTCNVRTVAVLVLVFLIAGDPSFAAAEIALPSPLRAADVAALARTRRPELRAAKARARAATQRPAIVSALEDPTVAVSLDHIPFEGMGVDGSLMFEQAFPLSRIRGHRKASALAGARRELASAERVGRDVELDAVRAYWMLSEARATAEIVGEQLALAKQLEAAALARYSTATAVQADVLRAQTETARLAAEQRALAAEVRAAEVMLNTSLARDPAATIPTLDPTVPEGEPVAPDAVAYAATKTRPELRAGRAEIEAAEAEARVMRAMSAPMAMIRTGPAYTMAEGAGWMVMVGVSIPLWRGRLRAGVAEADAMVEMATADLEAMRRMAEGEARGAREAVIAARERYRALRDEIVPRAQQAIQPSLVAYSAGQLPLVSVVEAAQSLWMARRELAMARAELGIAWARLRRAASEEVTP